MSLQGVPDDRLYDVIYADPPWRYNSSGDHLRATFDHRPNSFNSDANTASSHKRYGSMTVEEICDLQPPVKKDAHLYLWVTNSFIVEGHEVCRAWGFEPKTILTWGKVKPDGTPSAKMGYYFRGATEHIIFGVRGSKKLAVREAVPNLILTRRTGRHSTKPVEAYELIERCSEGKRIELFARNVRTGWDAWGNDPILLDGFHDSEKVG